MEQRKILFKVVVVGDGGVGKSTMVQRLTTGQFIPQKITIGTDLATYDINIDNLNVDYKFGILQGKDALDFFYPIILGAQLVV